MTSREELSHALQKLENKMCEKIGRRYTYFIEVAKSIIESLEDDLKEGIMDMRKQIVLDESESIKTLSNLSYEPKLYNTNDQSVLNNSKFSQPRYQPLHVTDVIKKEVNDYDENHGIIREQLHLQGLAQEHLQNIENRLNNYQQIKNFQQIKNSFIPFKEFGSAYHDNSYVDQFKNQNSVTINLSNNIVSGSYNDNTYNSQEKLVLRQNHPNTDNDTKYHVDINNQGVIDANEKQCNFDSRVDASSEERKSLGLDRTPMKREGLFDKRALTAAERQQLCRYRKRLVSQGLDSMKVLEETENFKRKLLSS